MATPRTRCRWLVILGVVLACTISSNIARAQQTYAFVVGVDRYEHLPNLQYASRDASEMVAMLKRRGIVKHQHVTLLTSDVGMLDEEANPTRERIMQSLGSLLGQMTPRDRLIVAFSGHGVQLDDPYGHFCPADADPLQPKSLLSFRTLYRSLERAPGSAKVVFLDTCRSQLRSASPTSATVQTRGLERDDKLAPPTKYHPSESGELMLFYACSPGKTSFEDSDLKHGVFVSFVLQGLRGKAADPTTGKITLLGLCDYVTQAVKKYTQEKYASPQVPVLFGVTSNVLLATTEVQPEPKPKPSRVQEPTTPPKKIDPPKTHALSKKAKKNRESKQDREMAEVFQTLLGPREARLLQAQCQQNPQLQARIFQGFNALQAQDHRQAHHVFTQVIQTNPQLAFPYICRSITFADQGNLQSAFFDVNQALQLEPNAPFAYMIRGMLYGQAGYAYEAGRDLGYAARLLQ